jgi:hypothetical protein
MGERLLREDLHISRLRDELLEREVFANLKEARRYWQKVTAITTTTIGRMELWGT